MKTRIGKSGNREIIFLSQEDKEVLIYTTSDAWITPETKRFKMEILKGVATSRFNQGN